MTDKFDLGGAVALVTGGRRGLGHAFARALASAGARVAISSRSAEAGSAAAQAMSAEGLEVTAVTGDVTSYRDVEAMAGQVEQRYGPVDVLVNNAGTVVHLPSLELSPESWRSVLSVNLDGLWYCSQVVGRSMVARNKGVIINIGSISGMIVNRPQWQPAYNASKAAVHQLTRSLAAEWAPYNVRVNALALGYVRTEMSPDPTGPEEVQRWVDDVPMKKMATPDEVAPAIVFLASEASSFMTGSVIVLDGGYTVY